MLPGRSSGKLASQPGLPRRPMHASSHRTRGWMAAAQRCIASGAALAGCICPRGDGAEQQQDQVGRPGLVLVGVGPSCAVCALEPSHPV